MTPPRLVRLRCDCGHSHWEIDCDFRDESGEVVAYGSRQYHCPGCGVSRAGFLIEEQSPPEFLLPPHPMSPMTAADFDYWVAILREHFPEHPKLRGLSTKS
jgi:hypothetical protein